MSEKHLRICKGHLLRDATETIFRSFEKLKILGKDAGDNTCKKLSQTSEIFIKSGSPHESFSHKLFMTPEPIALKMILKVT